MQPTTVNDHEQKAEPPSRGLQNNRESTSQTTFRPQTKTISSLRVFAFVDWPSKILERPEFVVRQLRDPNSIIGRIDTSAVEIAIAYFIYIKGNDAYSSQ